MLFHLHIAEKTLKTIETQRSFYRVFHGISGDDIGVVGVSVGRETIGEKADAYTPFGEMIDSVWLSPSPSHSDPRFTMPLLQLQSIHSHFPQRICCSCRNWNANFIEF